VRKEELEMFRFERGLLGLSAVAILACLFVASAGLAQTGTTSLRGTILDNSGAVITGATVTLSNSQQGFERTVVTEDTGTYEFLGLTPGVYSLRVEKENFRRHEINKIELQVNTPKTENVTLDIGSSTQTVEVAASTQVLNTTDASLGTAFNENQIKQLPLDGRNVPDLLTLQAGVVYTGNRSDINKNTDTRSGAVNGSRSDQSNITLDGVDVNDQVNGYAFTSVLPVSVDSVQEFRVTTSSYNADQGRSSGAQVSLVTKSGTNNWHGSLYEYHRNTITSANDYFVKKAELEAGDPNVAPKLIRNVFGASVGGAIKKDRLFFFLNYEGYRQAEEGSEQRIVPSDTLRQGIVLYQCATPSQCPGGPIAGTSFSAPAGFQALTSTNLTSMDPLHIGPNAVVLNYLNSFPEPNDLSLGDNHNFVGFRFRGAIPTTNNWYIARVDYKLTSNGNHSLFWRGALRNDRHSVSPYLPGGPSLGTTVDFGKGFTVGYTGTIRQNLLNNFRYGYTRQSIGVLGNNDIDPFIFFRGLNDNSTPANSSQAVTRSFKYQTPVHNIVDDVSWIRGRHTFQFGTNIRFIRNPRDNFLSSFSDAFTNSSGLDTAGLANQNSPLDPGSNGFPAVAEGFNNSYDYPTMALMGILSQLDGVYNYDKQGNLLPQNTAVKRHWGADEYEFYVQDVYKVKPTFTLTLGLRYSLFSPPWETTGTQVAPNIGLGDWFNKRGTDMLNGIGSNQDPLITLDLAGPENGREGYYNWDYKNFGPRVAFAYAPNASSGLFGSLFGSGKTAIRGGFGMVYDRIGAGLLNTFDQFGSFGLSTQLTNTTSPSVASAPRVTGLNELPTSNPLFPQAPPGGFPFTPPDQEGGLAINWGLDNSIKTPFSYTVDLSVSREMPKGFSFEVSYVGRFSHRLLVQEDLAMPLNLVDPASGISYFQAARRFSELGAAGKTVADIQADPSLLGTTAAYWQNLIAPLAPGDSYSLGCSGGSTLSPVLAAYDLFNCNVFNETTPLWQLDQVGSDFSGIPGIAGTDGIHYYPTKLGASAFFNKQFKSLYAWRSQGTANYNAMQASLHKRMARGLQFDLNYTFSKSIDIMSDAERITQWGGLGGQVINSWDPKSRRAISDYDLTQQINANWVVELPFGRGRSWGHDSSRTLDAFIGGWQLSGLARWTSGFPLSILNGGTWPTNWQLGGGAVQVGQVETGTTVIPATADSPSAISIFKDPQGATGIEAFRHAFPGESGGRNQIRGQGFAGLDMGLSKRWTMPWSEGHGLQFRWEVFNVPNLHRFDVQSINTNIDSGPAFGLYTGLLTNPRTMQFALRYEF
jgi:Carboxypeptidase regulatory-like domain